MSQNTIPDEELDDLFRKAAAHYDPPFDPEAWKAMDQKLEGAHGQQTWFRRYGIYLSMLLLLLGSTAVLLIKDKIQRDAKVLEQQVIASIKQATATSTSINPSRPGINEDQHKRNSLPPLLQKPEHSRSASVHGLENTAQAGGAHPSLQPKEQPAAGRLQPVRPGKKQRVTAQSIKYREPAEKYKKSAEADLLPYLVVRQTPIASGNSAEATDESIKKLPLPQPVTPSSEVTKAGPDTSSQEHRDANTGGKGIQLALLLAPDLTTVKFKDAESISANAGLLIGIPLTRKLSLVTGAVLARKVYQTGPENYAPSPGYWYGRHKPDLVEATCDVFDLPLNLRYQLLEFGKNSLSLQAGVSSYLMLKEKYDYDYQGTNPYTTHWEVSGKNRHWFGVQNLSVGYARQLTPAFALGAEPFVKLPYKGIGAGKVKLTSAGIFFFADFRLGTGK